MNSTLLYLIEAIATSAILYAAYTRLMERHTTFAWCRLYLLSLPLLSMVIPAFQIPLWPAKVIPSSTIGGSIETGHLQTTIEPATERIGLEELCLGIYLAGVVVMISLLVYQVLQLYRLKVGAEIRKENGVCLIRTVGPISTFSLFNTIWLWRGIMGEELSTILCHEMSHIRHRHSFERLLIECFKVMLWWNPFVWMAARRLNEVEEFEADHDVLTQGEDVNHYIATIFKHAFGYSPDIANGLHDSLTKKRFKMMIEKRKSRYARLRMAASLPLIALLMISFGTTARATTQIDKEIRVVAESDQRPIVVIVQDNKGGIEEYDLSKVDPTIVEHISIYKDPSEELTTLLDPLGITLSEEEISARGVVYIQLCDSANLIKEGEEALYSGLVVDRAKNPVVGAVIRLKGSDRGVVSDPDGRFTIRATRGDEAEIRMVGFEDCTYRFGGNKNAVIHLHKEGTEAETFLLLEPSAEEAEEVPATFGEGSLNEFHQWVAGNLKYPQEAIEQGIQGRVVVEFDVDKEGKVSNITVLNSPSELLSREVVRVMETAPRWNPGMRNGEPVATRYALPLDFNL